MEKFGGVVSVSAESLALMRRYRSLGVVWAIFSLCYNIILWVVITQDEWLGDRVTGSYGEVAGHFGLYSWCVGSECGGGLRSVSASVEATVTMATAALALVTAGVAALSTILFCKYSSSFVYKLCGGLQLVSGVLMTVTLLVYPSSWTNPEMETVCGQGVGVYSLGGCEVRWVLILAIIAACDGLILGGLALSLGLVEARLQTAYYRDLAREPPLPGPAVYTGNLGHTNLGFSADNLSVYGSKPGLSSASGLYMTPAPHIEEDRYSSYSHVTGTSQTRNYYNLVL